MSNHFTPQKPTFYADLPQSVEELLQSICEKQNQPPIDAVARHVLASLGEVEATNILRTISTQKIRLTLDGFIIHLARRSRNSSPSALKCACSSPCSPSARTNDSVMMSQGPQKENQNFPPIILDGADGQRHSPQLVALGELEFRKAFLLLSYLGEKTLEEAISADEIRRLKDLPMHNFELEVWNALGQQYIKKEERKKFVDWESGQTHLYRCYVSQNGSCRFRGPYLEKTTTHMHRVLGDDNVLMVKFAEEITDKGNSAISVNDLYTKYRGFASEGIFVGLRRYRFFVFKDGGKEEKKRDPTTSSVKCYFVRMESKAFIDKDQEYILSGKTIQEARSIFMHVHGLPNVAKYMARFSLILSKTIKAPVDLEDVNIKTINDIKCQDLDGSDVLGKDGKPLIHTDGTGFISVDLALKCPKKIFKWRCMAHCSSEGSSDESEMEVAEPKSHGEEPPLLIQFRLFNKGSAVKGTFLVNTQLPPQTVQIRPSMIKVETDRELLNTLTKNSLELVAISNQPRKTYLSRNLIALLSYGGVPDSFFMDILMNALEEAQSVFTNKHYALKVALNHGEMDDLNVARMILSGIPLDEQYLQYRMSVLMKEEKKSLRAKLPISESYYLMGTVDPTGILESDEVCVILDNGQVSGNVLVYRNPGSHFGDIHVLKATYVKAMEEIVGSAKYAIFFPCKGPRSLADEMARGDFDGDRFFLSRNSQLLEHFNQSEPWIDTSVTENVSSKRPSEFAPLKLEEELFKAYLDARFHPNYTVGATADNWLAIMDRYLTLEDSSYEEKAVMRRKILQLVDIYYNALDAPKKDGRKIQLPEELQPDMYPHYLERETSKTFISKSILGLLYDKATQYQTEDLSNKDIEPRKLLCLDEASGSSKAKWRELYDKYRQEMTEACRQEKDINEAASEVIRKYKQELYGAAEFEESMRCLEEIYDEALAIYHLVYDHAKKERNVARCGFAWKVAGAALCNLYAGKQGERRLFCLPSVLKEAFGLTNSSLV